ncbi:MAG: T9SS type A sorting domain-containing protein [Bacteroidia bacterium]|nr:T9SS type A sorting domain-containing protein [Bacteroidia bacterium]
MKKICPVQPYHLTSSETFSFDISPNPSKGNFKLFLRDKNNSAYLFQIIDMAGRTIKEQNIIPNHVNELNISVQGAYILKLFSPSGIIIDCRKLIVN